MQNRIALAVILTAGLLSSAAFAQSAQEQQLCMDDAFKVCSATPFRTATAPSPAWCRTRPRLSGACQRVMDKYSPGGNVQTAAAPAPTTPVRRA